MKAVCEMCGKGFESITNSHLRKHDMTMEGYKDKYPDAPLVSKARQEYLLKHNASRNGAKTSEETKAKISALHKGKVVSKESKERMSSSTLGSKHSEETKNKISRSMKGKMLGAKNPMFGKTPAHGKRVPYTCRKDRDFTFRSGWEHKVAVYLDANGCNWDYEVTNYNMGDITYTPDFFLYTPEGKLIAVVEVKGWLTEKAKCRMDAFVKHHPQIPLCLWDEKELKRMGVL